MKFSIAAANGQADALAATFAYGVIELWSGSMPADAGSALTGTMLARITKDGASWSAGSNTNGLRYGPASNGVLGIYSGYVFAGTVAAAGTVGFAVMKGNAADGNGAVTTANPRVLLTVSAGGGAECNLSHLDLEVGETVTVNSVAITQPRS